MIRGIHHVALHTPNFDKMLDFYREAFGFVPAMDEMRWENSTVIDGIIGVPGSAARTLMLTAGNCYLEMFEYFSPPARGGERLRPNDHGYTHFCVDVTDIEAEFTRLEKLGMVFAQDRPSALGPIRSVYGKDPDGNVIEIQELTPDHQVGMEQLENVRL